MHHAAYTCPRCNQTVKQVGTTLPLTNAPNGYILYGVNAPDIHICGGGTYIAPVQSVA